MPPFRPQPSNSNGGKTRPVAFSSFAAAANPPANDQFKPLFKTDTPPATPPASATDYYQQMIAVCEELGDTAEQETTMLKSGSTANLEALVERKVTLTTRYTELARHFRDAGVDGLDTESAANLRAAITRLQSRICANEIAVAATRAVAQSVMKAIHDKMQEHAGGTTLYSANGKSRYAEPPRRASVVIDCRA